MRNTSFLVDLSNEIDLQEETSTFFVHERINKITSIATRTKLFGAPEYIYIYLKYSLNVREIKW